MQVLTHHRAIIKKPVKKLREGMKRVSISKVEKGQFFKLSKASTVVYVREDYNRSTKKYDAVKFGDHDYLISKDGSFPVYVGNIFFKS